jgi:heat shock protein HslJ
MGMRWTRTLVVAAVLAVLVGACGDDDVQVGDGATTTAPSSLNGRTFVAQSVTEDGAPFDLVTGTEVRLTFADGTIGASAGCNSFGGDYTLADGSLRVGQLGGTEIGCDEARHAQDEWLVAFLAGDPAVALDGDELVLSTATTRMELLDREVADPDRPLAGTVWVLDSIIAGDTVSSVPTDEPLTLEIVDGRLRADTGCNTLGAAVTVERDRIVLGEVETTTAGCASAERRALEEQVTSVLTGTVAVEIEARSLTLTNGDAGLGYRAADE